MQTRSSGLPMVNDLHSWFQTIICRQIGSAMKLRTHVGGIAALTIAASLLIPSGAHASTENPGIDDLTTQQQEAIEAWEAGASNTSTVPKPLVSKSATTAAASGTSSMRLYRGSWVMWAEERVNFAWASGGRVTWSEAYQASGQVVPNWVKRNGTKKIYSSSTRHDWRGGYSVGASVPTPWGGVNVYSASSSAFSRVLSVGAWQKWE
ncbi:hypothetical protein [Microbacterium phyllosphaerae]|uniref:hypothetical protein n=1 Tax=Microbacterium phyllosphaerae TaxID=124798 RepID=UPI001ABF3E90|nr:hypothetical protein [Microbacterium phyllosphaerae]